MPLFSLSRSYVPYFVLGEDIVLHRTALVQQSDT